MSEMHQSMNIDRICRDLHNLHGHVIRNWGRIEITRDGESGSCVLMSRAELDCLERALEIFCESPAGQAICKELETIANRSTPRASDNSIPTTAAAIIGANLPASGSPRQAY
jgi:hypothetical protein